VDEVESDGFVEPLVNSREPQHISHPESEECWERFVACAEGRSGSSQLGMNDNDGEQSGIRQWGRLWEVGCKVSHERTALLVELIKCR
jgi:hypothetical protein